MGLSRSGPSTLIFIIKRTDSWTDSGAVISRLIGPQSTCSDVAGIHYSPDVIRRRAANQTRPTSRVTRESRSSDEIEQLLWEIFSQLANVLVSAGYGIASLNRLTRRAYFEAARQRSTKSPSKLSIAQIAAQTGLTRVEVSQLARENRSQKWEAVLPVNRAHRVSIGWQTDSQFCAASGDPRALPFAGKLRSFSQLAKKYSGDIPAKAMLLEMKRLKMVREDREGKLRLVRAGIHVPQQSLATLRAIRPWISFLSNDLSRHLSASGQYQLQLRLLSAQQSMAAIRELNKRARALAKGVEEIGAQLPVSRGYEVDVAIAFAATLNPAHKKSTPSR